MPPASTPCILHSFADAAIRLHANNIHLPLPQLRRISPENISHVRNTGAAGACVMSGAMTCADVQEYLSKLAEQ
ncbi:MAG: hypothetical protein U0L92_06635 [Clostridia bacterium]|nr:hypothetical protein [Clostridia bacterium]